MERTAKKVEVRIMKGQERDGAGEEPRRSNERSMMDGDVREPFGLHSYQSISLFVAGSTILGGWCLGRSRVAGRNLGGLVISPANRPRHNPRVQHAGYSCRTSPQCSHRLEGFSRFIRCSVSFIECLVIIKYPVPSASAVIVISNSRRRVSQK